MMVGDTRAKAEAHFNAYQAALERRDYVARRPITPLASPLSP
jgi:hypothetical protein